MGAPALEQSDTFVELGATDVPPTGRPGPVDRHGPLPVTKPVVIELVQTLRWVRHREEEASVCPGHVRGASVAVQVTVSWVYIPAA